MTPEQSRECEQLRTLLNGLYRAIPVGGQSGGELAKIDWQCAEVAAATGGSTDDEAQAWHRAAVDTRRLLRRLDDDALREFNVLYAELPPMEMAG
jgi:hypothetical protein